MEEKLTVLKDLASLVEKIIIRENKKKDEERSWGRSNIVIMSTVSSVSYRWPTKGP